MRTLAKAYSARVNENNDCFWRRNICKNTREDVLRQEWDDEIPDRWRCIKQTNDWSGGKNRSNGCFKKKKTNRPLAKANDWSVNYNNLFDDWIRGGNRIWACQKENCFDENVHGTSRLPRCLKFRLTIASLAQADSRGVNQKPPNSCRIRGL